MTGYVARPSVGGARFDRPEAAWVSSGGRRLSALVSRAGDGPRAAAALGVVAYVVVRACALVGIAAMCGRAHVDLDNYLWRYDGRAYVGIAEHGYDPAPGGLVGPNNLAFFPLFALLARGLAAVTPLGFPGAALAVAGAAGVVAAAFIAALARDVGLSVPAAAVTVALWAAAPHALVLSMAYSESLFCACAAAALWCALRRRWWAAGLAGAAAGLTRPAGLAVVVALGVAAAVAIVRPGSTARTGGTASTPRPWAALLMPAMAAAGMVAYPLWCWHRVGRWDAWLYIQRVGWHSRFDAGRYEVRAVHRALTTGHPAVLVECALTLVAATVLCVVLAVRRHPVPLVAYSATLVALAWGTAGYPQSKPRFVLPAFPLAMLLARALCRARPATVAAVLVGVVAVSSWYDGYLLTVWTFSP